MIFPQFDWTAEAIQQLRDLASQGLSATQIANQMGAPSRNSVIGKAHRIGIQIGTPTRNFVARPRPVAKPPEPRRRVEKVVKAEVAPEPLQPPPEPEPVEQLFDAKSGDPLPTSKMLPLLDMPAIGACRWPYGDPRSDEFRFCGADCGISTYCASHRKLAYSDRIVAIITGPRRAA